MYHTLCGVDFPAPALERGWLHGRQLKLPWDLDRLAARLEKPCWLSHYEAATSDPERQRLTALAGFWPGGGFIEVVPQKGNSMEDHSRIMLAAYAATPATCEALMSELIAGYVHRDEPEAGEPRVGILNFSYGNLEVQRIPISDEQTVARDQVALFYGAETPAWIDLWLNRLDQRRYGLTILSGVPGTGKTTLIRSLARWLSGSHMFYFSPATRFFAIESAEMVNFWAEENRCSKLRKILILEDAESVLQRRAEDNREKVAALLNLTDGMMGDALGLQVICTMNCGLADLDPALLRPGRLIGQREIGALSLDESRRLAQHLQRPLPDAPATLAEILHGRSQPIDPPRPVRRTLGFHATFVQTQT
ncbi:MAG TPA: AAA family ATPase [Candidatus Didemnitutus sp.]|nr:AAA family ATPase [Candidatus Didemnitutus sp.]